MCRVSLEERDSRRGRFVSVMAGPAQRNQVGGIVGRLHTPRNDVVNVHQFPFSVQVTRVFPALATAVIVADANGSGNGFPVSAPAVVFGRSTLPRGAVRSLSHARTRRNVAGVAAIDARIAIEEREDHPAVSAVCILSSNPAPSATVVASHIAEPTCSSVVGECLEYSAATFACFLDAGAGLPLSAAHPSVPSGASICAGAVWRAVFPPRPADEQCAAIGAGVMDCFHILNVGEKNMKSKYFDIACRRVDEASRQTDLFISPAVKPTQEALW